MVKKKTEILVSPEVISIFRQADEMRMNADHYLERMRQIIKTAWDRVRAEHPEVKENMAWLYNPIKGTVRLDAAHGEGEKK